MATTGVFTTGVAFIRSIVAGGGTARADLGGPLFAQITPASNVDTGETTLATYTLPGNTLNANGQAVRIKAWGSLAANGNTKTIKVYFGTTVVISRSTTTNGGNFLMESAVIRSGAAAQVSYGTEQASSGSASPTTPAATAPSETLSGAVVIKVTGQSGTASDDVTLKGVILEWLPAGTTVV